MSSLANVKKAKGTLQHSGEKSLSLYRAVKQNIYEIEKLAIDVDAKLKNIKKKVTTTVFLVNALASQQPGEKKSES